MAALPQLQNLDDDAWDDLLNYIEERRVIPIVGPDLLRVETERGPRLLYEWLAEKLAAPLAVDATGLSQPLPLNDVVSSRKPEPLSAMSSPRCCAVRSATGPTFRTFQNSWYGGGTEQLTTLNRSFLL